MPAVPVGETIYHVETHGSGRPLVLVSGLGADSSYWTLLLPFLSERFRVITFDNRGCGRTQDNGAPLTAESLTDGTAALIRALKLERPHVAGHSLGGNIALKLAARHPETVDRLVTLNTVPRWRPVARHAEAAAVKSFGRGVPLDCHLAFLVPWLFGNDFLDDAARLGAFCEAVANDPYMITPENLERQYNVLATVDAHSDLPNIAAATLVVFGEEDLLAPPEACKAMARNMPRADSVPVPGGHSSPIEQPELLGQILVRFLDGHPGRAPEARGNSEYA